MSLFTCKTLGSVSKVIYVPGSVVRCAGRLGDLILLKLVAVPWRVTFENAAQHLPVSPGTLTRRASPWLASRCSRLCFRPFPEPSQVSQMQELGQNPSQGKSVWIYTPSHLTVGQAELCGRVWCSTSVPVVAAVPLCTQDPSLHRGKLNCSSHRAAVGNQPLIPGGF